MWLSVYKKDICSWKSHTLDSKDQVSSKRSLPQKRKFHVLDIQYSIYSYMWHVWGWLTSGQQDYSVEEWYDVAIVTKDPIETPIDAINQDYKIQSFPFLGFFSFYTIFFFSLSNIYFLFARRFFSVTWCSPVQYTKF